MMDFMSEVRAKIASHPFKPICIEAQTRKKANARANKKWNAKNPGYNAKKKREAYWKLTEEERKEFNRQKRERMKARHGEDYYKKASKKYRESDRGKKIRNEYRLARARIPGTKTPDHRTYKRKQHFEVHQRTRL